MAEKKVRAIMIVEIAGRPPAHLLEALKAHVGQMRTVKGLDYISEKFSEPKLIDQEKDVYTCFAEVEIEVENMFKLSELVFDFFPSSIEVIEPESVKFNLNEATAFLNYLSGRLHKYDEIAKVAQIKNSQLIQRVQMLQVELAKHNVKKEEPAKKPAKEKSTKKKVKKSKK